MNKAALYNLINANFPDNNLRFITAAKARQMLNAMVANMFVLAEDTVTADGTREIITQPNHGFVKGDCIRDTSTAWVKSLAALNGGSSDPGEVYGVVSRIIDPNTFELTTNGKFDSTGLNLQIGKAYFLSAIMAGRLTVSAPNQVNQIVKCVVLAGRNNTAYVVNFVGQVLGGPDDPAPGVTDGDKTDIVVSNTGTTWLVKASRILGQVLTGLGSVSDDILDTDSIVLAFSKVKFFMANIGPTVRNTLATGLDANLPGTPASTDSIIQVLGKLTRRTNELAGVALLAENIQYNSATHTGNTLDFNTEFQSNTTAGAVAITTFTSTALGRAVKLTLGTGVTSFTVSVTGWTAINTGFVFTAGVVNVVDIIIISATQYEIFINPAI